ncbi:hypothetical protein L3X38_001409 [Prunus dulcis]|uniref:Uncharacterized protein n=1 Tax=Prunus dulcis TaxID=3755 RepID=A0AAD4WU07_PRUDU|nr:hypothetical protein L3X38_001409 [Prunus dulcis]
MGDGPRRRFIVFTMHLPEDEAYGFGTDFYRWHRSHLLTYSVESWHMADQKYPMFRAFWISICQVVDDVVLQARVLINLHEVNLSYLFDAWKVNVFDRDGASELGVQC